MKIINIKESATGTYKRKYQCPYCELRTDREDLVHHIEEEHINEVPKDYTPARIVFNIVNKKDEGRCIVCRSATKWNEDAWKYDRICSEKCRVRYKKEMDERMLNKYGSTTLLNDPKHQQKMLANRKISGEYKFKDGGVHTYTGSYEKNLLEFMDQVMDIPSKDIMMPGPIYEYKFRGNKHIWITDLLYIPFNLVFDVKDGGNNKNTHPNMQIDRDKQIEKEKTIAAARKHNYIRLTDNKFDQLLFAMVEIKKTLDEDAASNDPVIHINESVVSTIRSKEDPCVYLLPYSRNNIGIEGVGMISDLMMDNIFIPDENGIFREATKDFFTDKYYAIVSTNVSEDARREILNSIESEDPKSPNILAHIISKDLEMTDVPDVEAILTSPNTTVLHGGYNLKEFNIVKEISNGSRLYAPELNLQETVSPSHINKPTVDLIEPRISVEGTRYVNPKNNMATRIFTDDETPSRLCMHILERGKI